MNVFNWYTLAIFLNFYFVLVSQKKKSHFKGAASLEACHEQKAAIQLSIACPLTGLRQNGALTFPALFGRNSTACPLIGMRETEAMTLLTYLRSDLLLSH